MGKKISIDPVTRVEGHLKIEVEVERKRVKDAKSQGMLFRGFEVILKGRDPRDAPQITQRICGVCPTAHGTASARALDAAFGVKPPTNGRIVRNLILGANYLQSHILHFFHLAALDYVKGPRIPPFTTRYEHGEYWLPRAVNEKGVEAYLQAFTIRRKAQEMLAIFGGRMPHVHAFIPAGVPQSVTSDSIVNFYWRLQEVKKFIAETYLPLVYAIGRYYRELFDTGRGWGNFICYGVFPLDDEEKEFLFKPGAYTNGQDQPLDVAKITESVKWSWYEDIDDRNPERGATKVKPEKGHGYSFIKAPRYNGLPHEVGPLARMWITNPVLSKEANKFLGVPMDKEVRMRDLGEKAFSIMGRHVARAEECYLVANALEKWLPELKPGEPANIPVRVPKTGEGYGLSEAPRGSVGHWIKIKDGVIDHYQIIAPTTWNASPRDSKGQRGPIEEALIGVPVPDPGAPINILRLVRAFDP